MFASILKVAQLVTAQASMLLTLLGIVQLSVDTKLPFPAWVSWLGAIALLVWTACRLQRELDEFQLAPRRDKHLKHALYFGLHGRWPTESSPTVKLFLGDGDFERGNALLGELRRHARDGTVTIWGQPYSAAGRFDDRGVLPPIEREYWDNHELDLRCLAAESLESVCTEHGGSVRDAGLGLYCGLMVVSAKSRRFGPHDGNGCS
jgi:hypothetical protein